MQDRMTYVVPDGKRVTWIQTIGWYRAQKTDFASGRAFYDKDAKPNDFIVDIVTFKENSLGVYVEVYKGPELPDWCVFIPWTAIVQIGVN